MAMLNVHHEGTASVHPEAHKSAQGVLPCHNILHYDHDYEMAPTKQLPMQIV